MSHLLLVVPNRDVSYIGLLRSMLLSRFGQVSVHSAMPGSVSELSMIASIKKATHIATTEFGVIKYCDPCLEGTAADNWGFSTELPNFKKDASGYPVMFLPPLAHQFTNGGRFKLEHYLAKLNRSYECYTDSFSWDFVEPYNLERAILDIESGFLCAVDIETKREGLLITSVAYTVAKECKLTGEVITSTYVVKCNKETFPFWVTAVRRLNGTAVPKVMQNGQYDSAYFIRFNAPLRNWLFDTYNLMHCLFPEFPKDLAFMALFFITNSRFWKDESKTNLYEYNAKDTHQTLWVFMAMLRYCSNPLNQYALRNYVEVFPKVFPMLYCGLDGLEVDDEKRKALRAHEAEKKRNAEKSIQTMIGVPGFNPNSPKQVMALVHGLGAKQIKTTDVKEMQKFAELSPLNRRVRDAITAYRAANKAISTYFDVELFEGNRLMYQLDPSGTDTGRTASRGSQFWIGTQVQNIPPYARAMVIAPEGWSYVAVDKAQAESYCTGFISQDIGLINAVTTSPDFHCHNASMFFGIPFNELFDVATRKKLRVDIRNLAKRVNHGANYNMGPDVLLETMGTASVLEAQRLLGLPKDWSLRAVCVYLLQCFDRAYPRIRSTWYAEVVAEIRSTGKLVTPDGWTRRTFLQPEKSKLDLNAAVAHKPQGLSVRLVNRALVKVWHELQLKKYYGKFRLKAQIHDEIMFMARDDIVEAAAKEVAEIMEIPIKIEGRTMLIPSTYEIGKCWKDLK
jgi:hypothetical protein